MRKRRRKSQGCLNGLILLFLLGLIIGLIIILVNFLSNKDLLLPPKISENKPAASVITIPNTPYISVHASQLYLNGKPFKFSGFNAYNLGSLNGVNAGCGGQMSDIDGFFSSLRPNSVIRTWAFQGSIGTNVKTKQIDFAPLDRIANSAAKYNQKLLLVFTGQAGTCDDGHWKDKAWYSEGFREAFNDDQRGLAPLPYIDYVTKVVEHFKDSTTIAMWELVNEPESSDCSGFKGDSCYTHQTCPDEKAATYTLRTFYDTVGGIIKRIDKNHLIESGVIGTGQCGAIFEDYTYIHQSPAIDIASYHDYGSDNAPMPGDIWNGLQKRLNQMKIIQKPLIIGEVGMLGYKSPQCLSLEDRRDKFKNKMDAEFAAGIVGYLPWDYTGGNDSPICNFDIGANDPLTKLIHDYPLY